MMKLTPFSFFKKNFILFLMPILVPLLVLGAFSIIITKHYIEAEINKNNINLLKQTKENLELIFNELDSLNLNLSTNPEITINLRKILNNPKTSLTLEEYRIFATIKNFVDAPANARPYIHSIYIYFNNKHNRFISTTDGGIMELRNFNDQSWYESYRKQKQSQPLWTEPRVFKNYPFESTLTRVLSIYRQLYPSHVLVSAGVVVLNVKVEYIEELLDNLNTLPGQSILILDENNRTIFKNKAFKYLNETLLTKIIMDKRPLFTIESSAGAVLVSQLFSNRYRWRFVSTVPLKSLYKVSNMLQSLTFTLIVFSFVLGAGLTYWLANKNYHQIQSIISIIDSAENGQPLPPAPSQIKNEYGYIIHNILKTFIEQNYLKIQLSERKYKLRFMELLALQSQINPHFLFNTLETIKWKAIQYTKKPNEASKMLEELSQILKYSLESPGKKVALREEIANTRSYIEIQKIRYKDKFDAIWEYDEPVLNCPVSRLIIQPLIENAIYHGIKPVDKKCLIKIKIYQRNHILKISVVDDGLGISKEKLNEIRAMLNRDSEYTQHVGLYNTNKRLKLIYGDEYGLKIRGKEGLGTAVYIRIPVETGLNDSPVEPFTGLSSGPEVF